MKMYLLGILTMYLVAGIIIYVLGSLGKDIDNIYCYIFAPQFVLTTIISVKLRIHFLNRNLKSLVYDYDQEKWFYCEREDFEEIERQTHKSDKFTLESLDKALRELSKQYSNIYRKNLAKIDSRYIPKNLAKIDCRYVPKKVWKNYEKIDLTAIKEK